MQMHVTIGGDLPFISLESFQRVLLSDGITEGYILSNLVDIKNGIYCLVGLVGEKGAYEQALSFDVEMQIDASIGEPVYTLMGLDEYCEKNNLTITKLLPPHTSSFGEHSNECIYYHSPGMKGYDCYPTDGDGRLVVLQDEVIALFKQLWYLHTTRAKEDCPLLINSDEVYTKEYARLVLQGKTFDEIYQALLKKHVGCEPPVVPPFRII